MAQQPALARIQRPYFRNGPPHRAGADVSFADIVKIFDFQRIRLGRWVNATETQLAANLFFDAFADLQLLLGVPPAVISLNGSLTLSFGSGGMPGTCAFYQPAGRLLALAKNAGGGSLAHEWFHAFDHYIASRLFERAGNHQLASQLWLTPVAQISHPLNQLLSQGFAACLLDDSGTEPSAYFRRAQQTDQQYQLFYYAKPEELCARAFEHLLERQRLKNSFLVSGTRSGKAAAAGIYPTAAESDCIGQYWLRYFHWLGEALQQAAGGN